MCSAHPANHPDELAFSKVHSRRRGHRAYAADDLLKANRHGGARRGFGALLAGHVASTDEQNDERAHQISNSATRPQMVAAISADIDASRLVAHHAPLNQMNQTDSTANTKAKNQCISLPRS